MRLPERLTRPARAVRRGVLARRRLLSAALAAVAVVAGLQAATAPAPATVAVTVAAHDLPAGTVVGADDLVSASWAPGTAPASLPDPVGRVLAAPVRAGEPVTDVRLVGAALAEGLPGRTAVPVRLPDAGMAGLLEVGDRIDLLAADPQAGGADVVAGGVPVLALPVDDDSTVGGNGLTGRLVVVGAAESEVTAVADAASRFFLTFAWSR